MSPTEDQGQGPVIRDRRRIDPATGQVREPAQPGPQRGPGGGQPRPGRHSASSPGSQPDGDERPGDERPGSGQESNGTENSGGAASAGGPAAGSPGAGVRPDAQAAALAERTADLQRLQAEYANYRKRVERDRQAVREQALAGVLSELLPVLDDIGRAREHGELSGGFKSVADSLESIAGKLGLTTYGEPGDPFDPTVHEALMHEYSGDVFEPTCVQILQPGYKVGDRIIRPARVAVAEPAGSDGSAGAEGTAGDDDDAQAAPDGAED